MKKILINIIIIAFLISCKKNHAKLEFEKSEINLDTIVANAEKTAYIKLRNTGNTNLIISNFECSCECTIPDLKKDTTIQPSDSLSFKVSVKGYDNDKGKWKMVLCTIKSNTDSIFSRFSLKYFTQ